MKAKFYEGELWKGELENLLMPMLDRYEWSWSTIQRAKFDGDAIPRRLKEFLFVFLLLAPFFASFATYRIYVVGESADGYFNYGTALVNALVLSKIILIGDLAKLDKSSEHRRLIVSTLHKQCEYFASRVSSCHNRTRFRNGVIQAIPLCYFIAVLSSASIGY